jgi:phosphomannomutase
MPMSDAPLMLSISGLRGLVGQSLTEDVARRYAAAVGSWLVSTSGRSAPHVVIGRDSRPSGAEYLAAASEGLTSTGCRVTDVGILSTPGVALMVDHLQADGGMVITASHNPGQWNGIKTLRHDGVAPPPADAQQIIDRFKADDVLTVPSEQRGRVTTDDSGAAVHLERIVPHVDVDAIRGLGAHVVLESVHGAGGPETKLLLDHLGVTTTHLYAEPTGAFPHSPEPTAENLVGLCDAMKQSDAVVGFAQDPDADRLALVDETGRYIGEEYTLALCAMQVLRRAGAGASAVANLSSSRMLDDVAAKSGAVAYRAPVGEANVAAKMREHGAVIGGEGNGGVIWPAVGYVRDSLVGVALILELLAHTGKTLSELVASIPAYTIIKQKMPIAPGMAEAAVTDLAAHYADQKIDTQDGIRIDTPGGWIHVRASNTEPIMRVIAEARDGAAAERLIDEVRGVIGG